PRVIVLADAPELTAAAQEALETYLKEGGGILVALGPRAGAAMPLYNDRLHRQGHGWLPAALGEIAGEPGGAGVNPEPTSFQHPALELLRKGPGGTGQVAFPRWWRLHTNGKGAGSVVARL